MSTLKTVKAFKPMLILGDERTHLVFTDKKGDKHTIRINPDEIRVGFDIDPEDKAKMSKEEKDGVDTLADGLACLFRGDVQPLLTFLAEEIDRERERQTAGPQSD